MVSKPSGRGSLGDAGKNLYVSGPECSSGSTSFDLNGDGYVDLPFSNSQEHWETPPPMSIARRWPRLGPVELITQGARCGVVADLNRGWLR